MRRKGQAAMEFLMTYGWALLIVIIVIAALAFFGLLNPGNLMPEKCDLGPGLSCTEFAAYETDMAVIVNNGLGQNLVDPTIIVNDCNGAGGEAHTIDYDASTNPTPTYPPGADMTFDITCDSSLLSGSKIQSDASFMFTTNGGLDQTKSGHISANVMDGSYTP